MQQGYSLFPPLYYFTSPKIIVQIMAERTFTVVTSQKKDVCNELCGFSLAISGLCNYVA